MSHSDENSSASSTPSENSKGSPADKGPAKPAPTNSVRELYVRTRRAAGELAEAMERMAKLAIRLMRDDLPDVECRQLAKQIHPVAEEIRQLAFSPLIRLPVLWRQALKEIDDIEVMLLCSLCKLWWERGGENGLKERRLLQSAARALEALGDPAKTAGAPSPPVELAADISAPWGRIGYLLTARRMLAADGPLAKLRLVEANQPQKSGLENRLRLSAPAAEVLMECFAPLQGIKPGALDQGAQALILPPSARPFRDVHELLDQAVEIGRSLFQRAGSDKSSKALSFGAGAAQPNADELLERFQNRLKQAPHALQHEWTAIETNYGLAGAIERQIFCLLLAGRQIMPNSLSDGQVGMLVAPSAASGTAVRPVLRRMVLSSAITLEDMGGRWLVNLGPLLLDELSNFGFPSKIDDSQLHNWIDGSPQDNNL
ncbi:MAG: hypothetical protein ACREJ2_08350 [Planctomycetota bacterium]